MAAVMPNDVAVELGQLPLDEATEVRYKSWIDRAERMIRRQADRLGVAWEDVDLDTVHDVVLLAVAQHARNPEAMESVDISVDDGREMRRYRSSGEIAISDLWWSWLFPDSASGAFSVRPHFEPDTLVWP